MVKELTINGVKILTDNLVVEDYQEDEQSSVLKQIGFSFVTVGENEFNLFKSLLDGKELNVSVLNDQEPFKARRVSYSYRDPGEFFPNTETTISVTLREIIEGEEKPSFFTNLGMESIAARVRFNSLLQLLEEKGILTHAEYTDRFEKVKEENFEKYKSDLTGLTGEEE
jgi:hypothetical protein